MKSLYTVNPSPGKGRGVFTTKAISPGTTIMNDPVALKIDKDSPKINEADVDMALSQLSKTNQARFMALHEGLRPYRSKAFRIFKTNAFAVNGGGCIYLDVSLINHSCLPNAEYVEKEASMEVIAVKPIPKGDEVVITYNPHFVGLAKKHRRVITRVYYGFECDCPACCLPPPQQAISDSRREILNVLTWNLQGTHPPDSRFWDFLATLTPQQAEDPRVRRGNPVVSLRNPLTVQQNTVYSFLLAKMFEAEGLVGERLATAYTNAAHCMRSQMDDIFSAHDKVIVMSMAKLAIAWMREGVELQKRVRGNDHESYRSLYEFWEELRRASIVSAPWQCAAMIGDGYTIKLKHWPNGACYVEVITEEHCRSILKIN